MAEIAAYPFIRHLRAEPTAHVLHYRRGALARDGAGLAFWFRPIHTAVAEVPIDDRELPFLFHVRSADFQELTVQGAIAFRVADPRLLARRVDFTIDLAHGAWTQAPLEQVAALLTQLAQQFVIDELVRLDLRTILTGGVAPIRDRIAAGLAGEPLGAKPGSLLSSGGALGELGLEVVAVRVAAVTPTAEVEKALRQPTREAIQTSADEATFARRALATEKERAIIEQDAANQALEAQATDERARVAAKREADTIDMVEAARLRAERERAEIQAAVPVEVLLALALKELAGGLNEVTVTPDLLAPVLKRLAA
jgi:regulator of protease activity HflC (stomatin/prohibitin superfamily)